MNVRIQVQFESPTADDLANLRRVAISLTNDPASVRVFPREDQPEWLVGEFTMRTEAQYKAVDTIDGRIRFSLWNRMDSIIGFPKDDSQPRRPRKKRAP